MPFPSKKVKFLYLSFLKHDLKAGITVFFVALPLCLGISLASGAPVYSGLLAGMIGGLIVSVISGSQLSVSGPAAGLTAISAAAIVQLGGIDVFFLSVALAGILQILLGTFRLGNFTHFIPSAVIKGMLAAIGIILISKQVPPLIGYNKPEFWSNELFNIITFHHLFSNVRDLYASTSAGAIVIAGVSFAVIMGWNRFLARKIKFIPSAFLVVLLGMLMPLLFNHYIPSLKLNAAQFVNIPAHVFSAIRVPSLHVLWSNREIWKYGVVICFVASLETLLSVEAIDKLDPYNRITPQNRELIAQGTGNFLSGLLGGIPITAVIVRSSANAEAGARTWLAAFVHGLLLVILTLFAVSVINMIPYCVLAVILIRTGYNLAKPRMIAGIYKQGREQFMPFLFTVVAILFTDLLVGVLIGLVYSIYFIVKHTYRAGFALHVQAEGHHAHYTIDLALNVSFLNKKRFIDLLEQIPEYSVVEIDGSKSIYIDHDILEIFQEYKSKAHLRHIQLVLNKIPEVQTIGLH